MADAEGGPVASPDRAPARPRKRTAKKATRAASPAPQPLPGPVTPPPAERSREATPAPTAVAPGPDGLVTAVVVGRSFRFQADGYIRKALRGQTVTLPAADIDRGVALGFLARQ